MRGKDAPSSEALNKTSNHLVEFRWVLQITEMACLVDYVHLSAGRAPGNQFKEYLSSLNGRCWIVVTPDKKSRRFETAPLDPLKSLFLLHRELRKEPAPLEPHALHLPYRLLILGEHCDSSRGVEPVFGDMAHAVGIALEDPALTLPGQSGLGSIGKYKSRSRRTRSQSPAIYDDARPHHLRVLQGQPGHQVSAPRVPCQVNVSKTHGLKESIGVPNHRCH